MQLIPKMKFITLFLAGFQANRFLVNELSIESLKQGVGIRESRKVSLNSWI